MYQLAILIIACFNLVFSYPVSRKTSIQFHKKYSSSPSFAKFAKRNGEYLTNGFTLYTVDLRVGTPAQELTVYIDTGSADLWFQTPDSLQCSTSSYSNITSCSDIGVPYFNPMDSSSIIYNHSEFQIMYVSGTLANGTFVSDTVNLGDLTIENQMFGIANETNSQELSLLGLGFDLIEYAADKYPNFISRLYSDGIIDKKLYSIYLNSQFSEGGSILFGGIDDSKYSGELISHDLVSETEFFIQSNGTTFDGVEILSDMPMLLDTGSTAMSIPTEAFKKIISNLNATFNYDYGFYNVVCEKFNTSGPDLKFQFGEQQITIGPQEYLINYNIGTNGESVSVQNDAGEDMCFLGFQADETVILGDTFIRSVYVVYDLENKKISLAKASWLGASDPHSSSACLSSSSTTTSTSSCPSVATTSTFHEPTATHHWTSGNQARPTKSQTPFLSKTQSTIFAAASSSASSLTTTRQRSSFSLGVNNQSGILISTTITNSTSIGIVTNLENTANRESFQASYYLFCFLLITI